MTITKAYYIPYTDKARGILRRAERRLGIVWTVDTDECVTITVKASKVAALEHMLAPIV
jgi:hypothetical protein